MLFYQRIKNYFLKGFFSFGLLIATLSNAQSFLPKIPKPFPKCRIQITQTLHNHKKEKSEYIVKAKNKKDCLKKSQPYKNNFAPHLVKEKLVEAKYE